MPKNLETGIMAPEAAVIHTNESTPDHLRQMEETDRDNALKRLLRTGKLKWANLNSPPVILGEKQPEKR